MDRIHKEFVHFGIMAFAIGMLAFCLSKCSRPNPKVQKVEQVKKVKEKEVYQPTIYIYPSGATGTLPHDWETGQAGIPINN